MKRWFLIASAALVLAGCGQVERVFGPRDASPPAPVAAPDPQEARPSTPEALDTTTEPERQAARREAATGSARALGTTIATLGAPSEPGLWLKTPLVDGPGRGRVDYAVTGQSVALDLVPLGGESGAGSQLSLSAFRAIGASLTDLPELQVYRLLD